MSKNDTSCPFQRLDAAVLRGAARSTEVHACVPSCHRMVPTLANQILARTFFRSVANLFACPAVGKFSRASSAGGRRNLQLNFVNQIVSVAEDCLSPERTFHGCALMHGLKSGSCRFWHRTDLPPDSNMLRLAYADSGSACKLAGVQIIPLPTLANQILARTFFRSVEHLFAYPAVVCTLYCLKWATSVEKRH